MLTVEANCLMWGMRVVIPAKYRSHILEKLHLEHSGMTRMKAVARSYVWWPSMDADIEDHVKVCLSCQSVKGTPLVASLHPWICPSKPWQHIYIDYAGPFKVRMFLVVVDAHSKWPEVCEVASATAEKTIAVLRECFAQYGLPEQLVSDNGTEFCSAEFDEFLKQNGVCHVQTAPYHPASNGAAERFVQTFKLALKTSAGSPLPTQLQLERFF